MPTVFVTGITGQDGGYLAESLIADGAQVHGLVRPGDQALPALLTRTPSVRVHNGDLADPARIARLVDEIEPDEIYNLGGVSSVALSWQHPLMTAQVTGLGAVALLDAAWAAQQRLGRPVRVVQASSAEIFGAPDETPQTERTPLRPQTPYGAAKAFAHHMVAVYRSRGLHASACILYNHESPRRPDTFVTRKITKAAAEIASGRRETLTLGNVDVRRDWGWAPDYVEAMRRAIRHDHPDDYVVATGRSHSVRDFAEAAFRHAGVWDWRTRITVDETLVRPMDAPEQVGDAGHAHRQLGWLPTVGFDDMVAAMVEADLAQLGALPGMATQRPPPCQGDHP